MVHRGGRQGRYRLGFTLNEWGVLLFATRRGLKISTFGALVMLGSLLFQGVSSAHHPEIVATPQCYSATTARITVTASAWVTPEPGHRINNNVEVTIAGQTFSGAFTDANGYQFSGTVDVPADGATYTARATAIAPWGLNGEYGSAGEFRETTVTVPNECVAGATSTTLPPTTLPTTTSPSTTAPSTTAPSTTVLSITAPTSTVATGTPTPTVAVEVQGITETRADILARTGTNTMPLMVMGAALVLVGAFVELSVRRRRQA